MSTLAKIKSESVVFVVYGYSKDVSYLSPNSGVKLVTLVLDISMEMRCDKDWQTTDSISSFRFVSANDSVVSACSRHSDRVS